MKKSSVFKTVAALLLVGVVMAACSTTQAARPVGQGYEYAPASAGLHHDPAPATTNVGLQNAQNTAQQPASQAFGNRGAASSKEALRVRSMTVVCIREKYGDYIPISVDNESNITHGFATSSETSVCIYDAAITGVEMIERFYGADLYGTTVTMRYHPRTEFEIIVYERPYANARSGQEIRNEEYSAKFTQYFRDKDVSNLFGRQVFQTFMNAFPDMDLEIFSIATQSETPSLWNGVIEKSDYFYTFWVNAETGQFLSVQQNPLVTEGADSPAGTKSTLEERINNAATKQHNTDAARHAMDVIEGLGIFESPVVRARIVAYFGGSASFRHLSTVLVQVESVNGERVELRIEGFLENDIARYGLSMWRFTTAMDRIEWHENGEFTKLQPFDWVYR